MHWSTAEHGQLMKKACGLNETSNSFKPQACGVATDENRTGGEYQNMLVVSAIVF